MRIYIVPYRDRAEHLEFFKTYISHVDPITSDYRVLIIHQRDQRPFNRGAMKNIGFLAVKQLYPQTYKNISLIFNDVDIMPFKEGVFYADTLPGIVRHNYGYTTCLSASFVIKAGDFERTGGFPNLWTWGLEDYLMQERAFAAGLKIDRSRFRPVGDRTVLQFFDGITRNMSTLDVGATRQRHLKDGLATLQAIFSVEEDGMVQVSDFVCMYNPDSKVVVKDIRELGVNARAEDRKQLIFKR
jgi:hypothetical protein